MKLYCIELIPKRHPDLNVDLTDPFIHAMSVRVGIADMRERKFYKFRQRLAVFTVKKNAQNAMKSCVNEYWDAKVRAVRFMDEPTEDGDENRTD